MKPRLMFIIAVVIFSPSAAIKVVEVMVRQSTTTVKVGTPTMRDLSE